MEKTLDIMVVDGEAVRGTEIGQALEEMNCRISTATNATEALEACRWKSFPIVFIDSDLPEMTGFELLAAFRKSDPDIQGIVMDPDACLESAVATLRSGGCDYLAKPFESKDAIVDAVRRAAARFRRRQEHHRSVAMLREKNESLTEANHHLRKLATHDGLTGLHNHRFFRQTLQGELNRTARYGNTFSLIFMDLDHFKMVNDAHGHLQGDKLLVALSRLLVNSFRQTDSIARYGGDEFAIILPETAAAQAGMLAARLYDRVSRHDFAGREILPRKRVTVSIGFATYPQDGADADTLLHHADQMMYRVKKKRGQIGDGAQLLQLWNPS